MTNLRYLIEKMRTVVRQAVVSLVSKDDSDIPKTQIKYLGKTSDAVRLSPYGLCANAPLGSLGVIVTPSGSKSIKYWIGDSMYTRMKNLKEGEVAVYNHLSQSYVFFKEDGTIEIEAKKNLEVEVSGNVSINVSGSATITAPSTTINSTTVINGNTTITGTLNSGAITTPSATIGGKDFAGHAHTGVQSGTSNTGPVA